MIVFFEKVSGDGVPYIEKSIDITNTVIDWEDEYNFYITHINNAGNDKSGNYANRIDYTIFYFEMENAVDFLVEYRNALLINKNYFTARIK